MAAPDPAGPLRRYLRIQTSAEKEVDAILRGAMGDVDKQLADLRKRGGIGAAIRRTQLQASRFAVLRVLADIWRRLGLLIRERSVDAALAATEEGARWDDDVLDRIGIEPEDRAAWQRRLEAAAERSARLGVNRRFDTSGGTNRELSERVYGSLNLANRLVQKKIESALTRGLSADELAKEIRDMIRPDVQGGVSYAAKRLARTEINNAFHYQQIKDAEEKPWVVGLRWRLSGSHPAEDICDVIAKAHSPGRDVGVYDKDKVPDKPHPQCLCSLIPVTQDPEDFIQGLLAELPPASKPEPPIPAAPSAPAPPKPEPPKPASKKPVAKQTAAERLAARKAANKALPVHKRKILGDKSAQSRRQGTRTTAKQQWEFLSKAERAKARETVEKQTQKPMRIRMSQKALDGVIKDGRVKSAHEVAGRDSDYLKTRTAFEDSIMDYDDAAPADRPIYGYVGDLEDASGYGDFVLTLNENVRNRITVSGGDSLNDMLDVRRPGDIAGLSDEELLGMLGYNEIRSLAEGEFNAYMEMQVPNVTAGDIATITVPSDAPDEFVAKLRAAGFRVEVELSEEDRVMAELKRKLGIE